MEHRESKISSTTSFSAYKKVTRTTSQETHETREVRSNFQSAPTLTITTTQISSSNGQPAQTRGLLENSIWNKAIGPFKRTPLALQETDAATFRPMPARTAFGTNTVGNYNSRPTQNLLASRTFTPPANNSGSRTNIKTLPSSSVVSVPRPLTPLADVSSYPIKGNKIKGKVLIINNIKFLQSGMERHGAEKDGKDLVKLFKSIGLDITYEKNLKGQQMEKLVLQYSQGNFRNVDVSIVVMMSHGTNVSTESRVAVRGGYTEISGVDHSSMISDDVIEQVTSNSSLEGKPKIFIFQCCRGDNDQIQSDATRIAKVFSDVLVAFSTLPGFLSNRDPANGSWYIQSICDIFQQHYKQHHVEDMLKMVDTTLSNKHEVYKQTSTYESRGFNKKCYLHPR